MFMPPEVGESKDKYVSRGQVRDRLSCQAEKLKLFPSTRGACKGSGREASRMDLTAFQKMGGPV